MREYDVVFVGGYHLREKMVEVMNEHGLLGWRVVMFEVVETNCWITFERDLAPGKPGPARA